MSDALLAAWLHVPADLEGVAGDVADLDVLRNGELLHLRDAAVLGFTSCVVEKQNEQISIKSISDRKLPGSYLLWGSFGITHRKACF